MAVEVDHADGAVGLVHAAHERERDGVVAAERDDARQRRALDRGPGPVRVGRRLAEEDRAVAVLDLLDGVLVIVPTSAISKTPCRGRDRRRSGGTYEVTGMSPQSRILAQLWKGLAASGTL